MKRADHTKQLLLEAASRAFYQHGVASTGLRAIESLTGLTKGSIYGHFGSKENLIREAFAWQLKRLNQQLVHLTHKRTGFTARLLTLFDFLLQNIESGEFPAGCPLMKIATELRISQPEMAEELLQPAFESWQKRLVFHVEEGQLVGEINATLDAERFANWLICQYEGAAAFHLIRQSPAATKALANDIKNTARYKIALKN